MNMKAINGSKMRSAMMLVTLPILPVLMIPVSKVALDSGRSEIVHSAGYVASALNPGMIHSQVSPPVSAPEIKKFTPAVRQESLKARQTSVEDKDGNIVRETFDSYGRRVTKTMTTGEGVLLGRWYFNPINKKILRYEVNTYQEGIRTERRVARWEYNGQDAFVKTNRIFDGDGKTTKYFMEYVDAKGFKYQERWYDSKARLVSEKRWNSTNGSFRSGFLVSYLAGGWSRRQYLDTQGHTFREVLFTPKGEVFKVGGIEIALGKQR